jgi:hypothetical protein
MSAFDSSRREGGGDVLPTPAALYVALGVRLRERPDARWMVEMHPSTRTDFDVRAFDARFGAHDVRIHVSRYVAPGEYRLLRRGFGTGGDTPVDSADLGRYTND